MNKTKLISKANKLGLLFLLTFFFLISQKTYSSASEQVLVEYTPESSEDASSNDHQDLPASDVKEWIISKVTKETDETCVSDPSPEIVGYAEGSFTDKQAQESLYLVNIGDGCGPRSAGTIRIAIASGDQVTNYKEIPGGHRIKKITDINQNGKNEVLLEGGFLGQGYLTVWNQLLKFEPVGVVTLATFTTSKSNPGNPSVPTDEGSYKVNYETKSKIYYRLGPDNQLSNLRSDWQIRACGDSLPNTNQNNCTDFEPLLSFDEIPLYKTDVSDKFNDKFFRKLDEYIHQVCQNHCETY